VFKCHVLLKIVSKFVIIDQFIFFLYNWRSKNNWKLCVFMNSSDDNISFAIHSSN
jgi:hypothetical protein